MNFLNKIPNNIQEYVDKKLIRVQDSSLHDYLIYNYTEKCQYEKSWDDVTKQCRGLIATKDGTIIARPFPKFFNVGKHEELPNEPFQVWEKYDGSLGILYWHGNKPMIATRGSFESEQAIVATGMIEEYAWKQLDRSFTYLFEIIYPENRIVVDYGIKKELVLLAAIHTETGIEKSIDDVMWDGEKAKQYPIDTILDMEKMQAENKEGFVVRFAMGMRVKYKFDEYVRLHRLVTGVNTKTIWDLLRNNQSFDELLSRVPDEFYTWVKSTKQDLLREFGRIQSNAFFAYEEIKNIESRKDFAIEAQKVFKYPKLLFALRDGKPIEDIIWKIIKPKASYPFKIEI